MGNSVFPEYPDFICLYTQLEMSQLFCPTLGIVNFFLFISFLIKLVQSKVRRLPAQLLCKRLRRQGLSLPLLLVEVVDGETLESREVRVRQKGTSLREQSFMGL